MALPHLRTAAVSPPYQATYTLGGTERFRLDAARFTILPGSVGDWVIPVLRCTTPDGLVIVELTAAACQPPSAPASGAMATTAPSAFTDPYTFPFSEGIVSYNLEDHTADNVDAKATFTFPSPPATLAQRTYAPVVNSGTPSISDSVASASSATDTSVSATLYGNLAAGSVALIVNAVIDSRENIIFHPYGAPLASDTAGSGAIDTAVNQNTLFNAAGTDLSAGGAVFCSAWVYQLTGALNAGQTLTFSWPGHTPWWQHIEVHPLAGVRNPHPLGVTAPNITHSIVGTGTSSPVTTGLDFERWNSGVVALGLYLNGSVGAEIDAEFARGVYSTSLRFGPPIPPTPFIAQAQISDIHLEPQDTVTMFTTDDTFAMRTTDVISDATLWAVDDVEAG